MSNRTSSLLLGLILIISGLLGAFSPIDSLAASKTSSEPKLIEGPQSIGGNLSQWVLDEANNYIYAYSNEADKLLFINTGDLSIKKQFELPGISDMEIQGGKLYVALGIYKQVAVINIKTLKIEKKLSVKEPAYKIALDGNKLFYITKLWKSFGGDIGDYTKLYIYNLDNGGEKSVTPLTQYDNAATLDYNYSLDDIAIDGAAHKLYLTKTNGRKAYIYAISTVDYKTLDTCWEEGFTASGNIIVDNSDIFWGKYIINAKNLKEVYGSYQGYVTYVSGKYVLSPNGIFDRESLAKVGEFPQFGYYDRFLLGSKSNIYLYEGPDYSVHKGIFSQFLYDGRENDNITPASLLEINYDFDEVDSTTAAKRSNIYKWLLDETKGIIYAISKDSDALMFIGLKDLKLIKKLPVGSSPRHMTKSGDKLYISLDGTYQVAVVDLKTRTVQNKITLRHKPGALAVDGNKLFYMGYDEKSLIDEQNKINRRFAYLNVYDLTKKTDQDINSKTKVSRYEESNMLLDEAAHILYVGGAEGSEITAINTSGHNPLSISKPYEVVTSHELISMSGKELFYGDAKLDPDNLSSRYGGFAEKIIYAADGYAFSYSAVYDTEKYKKISGLPFNSEVLFMDSKKIVYLFDNNTRAIKKYSLRPAIDNFSRSYEVMVKNTDYSKAADYIEGAALYMNIKKMAIDEQNKLIYAISPWYFSLHIIGMDDRKLIKEVFIGSKTTDMELYGDKLYIAASKTDYVAVFDTVTQKVVKKIKLATSPKMIEIDNNKLFYHDERKLYVYDLINGNTKQILFHDYNRGMDRRYLENLFIDRSNNILYGRVDHGSVSPSQDLLALSTEDFRPLRTPVNITKHNSVSQDGRIIFRDNELFLDGVRYDRESFKELSQNLTERIIYADDKFLITSNAAYMRNTNAKLGDLPVPIDNMYVTRDNGVFILDNLDSIITQTSIKELLLNLKDKTEAYNDIDFSADWNTDTSDNEDSSEDDSTTEPGSAPIVTFPDISKHWAKSEIEYLASKHVVNGIGNSAFAPDAPVTREEITTLIPHTE